jgi:hypothetical protein
MQIAVRRCASRLTPRPIIESLGFGSIAAMDISRSSGPSTARRDRNPRLAGVNRLNGFDGRRRMRGYPADERVFVLVGSAIPATFTDGCDDRAPTSPAELPAALL